MLLAWLGWCRFWVRGRGWVRVGVGLVVGRLLHCSRALPDPHCSEQMWKSVVFALGSSLGKECGNCGTGKYELCLNVI